jgi:hypothetical protein
VIRLKEADRKKKFPKGLLVQRYNLKSINKPSIIFESCNRMKNVFDRRIGDRGLDIPGSCNHWPVGQAAEPSRRLIGRLISLVSRFHTRHCTIKTAARGGTDCMA